jgi:hypothetical protein
MLTFGPSAGLSSNDVAFRYCSRPFADLKVLNLMNFRRAIGFLDRNLVAASQERCHRFKLPVLQLIPEPVAEFLVFFRGFQLQFVT